MIVSNARSKPSISLRLKLTVWLLAVFSVVYAAMAFAAWGLLRHAGTTSVDERLAEISEGVVSAMQDENWQFTLDDLRKAQPIDRSYSVLGARDPQGIPVVLNPRVDASALPALPDNGESAVSRITSLAPEVAAKLVGHDVSTRMITAGFFVKGGDLRFVDIARTNSVHSPSMSVLQELVLIGVIGALFASMIASWLIAGRAVAPIRRLTEAASEVRFEGIERRLEITSNDAEVERLQHELNDALERIDRSYRTQKRFIKFVAHDLKTRIAVMLTESQVFRTGEASPEEIEAYRRGMIEEMQHLGGLVESFLTLARADQGEELAIKMPVPVNDLIIECVSRCEPEASVNEIRLIPTLIDPGDRSTPEVYGDAELLQTMLDNLISNAVRYSPPGGQVEISVVSSNGSVRATVRDDGPGLKDESLDGVFDRLADLSSPSRHIPDGVGLGLAIAKSVAELHNGEIMAKNRREGGCEITVILPLMRREMAA